MQSFVLLFVASCAALIWQGAQAFHHHARSLHSLPPYVRGVGNYRYILSEAARENGVSYLPSAGRLRAVVDKLKHGIPIRLATVGASIMAGQGSSGNGSLPEYIFDWFADHFPGLVTATNGAMPGTTSQYLSVCHNMHVAPDADLVIVDFTINDGYHQLVGQPFLNEARCAFERLIRTLLTYPKRPAVMLIHAYAWRQDIIIKDPIPGHKVRIKGMFWNNAERDYGEFERYYHLPSVSVKGCCYHYLHDNDVNGFVRKPRRRNERLNNGSQFYFDDVHPDGLTGCRVMAELIFHLITKVSVGLDERPLTHHERAAAAAPAALTAPMIPGNFETNSTKCFVGHAFTSSVYGPHDGWEWIDESKTGRPKWGFVATNVGASIRFLVDTRARVHDAAAGNRVLIQLSHLKSYEGMGQARVTCEGGCSCQPTVLQGHHTHHTSLALLHNFYATMAADCVFAITVIQATLSAGHKVKLTGLVVNEEAGVRDGSIFLDGLLEYIGAISMRGANGTYESQNHT